MIIFYINVSALILQEMVEYSVYPHGPSNVSSWINKSSALRSLDKNKMHTIYYNTAANAEVI